MHDTSIDDETMVGHENRLQQNYPNPFNPSTLISFSISQTDYVKLQVYNVKGQLVKTLISDMLDAGRHSITWYGDNDKGSAVSSGIYFYRLECSSHSQTKKMLLMK
jgi:flagellar hook assembly protein FlgD